MAQGSVGRLLFLVMLTLAVAAFGTPVVAQEAEPTQPEGAQEEAEATPEEMPVVVKEIVVTAQKRVQNVQDVPVSVSTLSGEDLEMLTVGTPDVRILSARVPSLILESSFGRAFPRFYIRGLGNSDFDLNASQPVSMLVDEIVLENPVVKGMPLFDLDQVEVLRGPQGTLFGRNTPAGVVKFDTKRPTQEAGGEFRASYGTYNTFSVDGGIGGPISDTFSYRISGLYQGRSDWVDNGLTGEQDALEGYTTGAARLQLLWEPNENFSALLNLHGWSLDGTARVFRANILEPGSNRLVGNFDRDVVYQDGLNEQDIDAQGGLLRLEYDFGPAVLTAITGAEGLEMYSRGDIDGGYGSVTHPPSGPGVIFQDSETADGIPSLDQFTQEVRVASQPGGELSWIAGMFYFKEELTAETFSYNSFQLGNPQNGYAVQDQTAESFALFGTLDWALNDRWNLLGGLRFSSDEKDFSAERPWPIFQSPTVAPIREHVQDDVITWDLSAIYKVDSNFNLYGRLATGFRAPSIQGRILFCVDFAGGTDPATNCVSKADTEEITSAEVGIKTILADSRLRLNLTGYYYEVDGQQVTAVGGQYNTATLLNVDTTVGYGFEADIEFTPTAHWLTTFGLSYNPTEMQDDNLVVVPCIACTVTDPLGPDGAMVDGNPLPHAPEWIVNAIINFRSSPVDKGWFGTLDASYHSEKNFFLYESEEFKDDAFELGLRLGYAWNQAKYEIALFGRNVTDEVNVEGGIDFSNLVGFVNEPRIVGVEFVGRF